MNKDQRLAVLKRILKSRTPLKIKLDQQNLQQFTWNYASIVDNKKSMMRFNLSKEIDNWQHIRRMAGI